MRKRGILAASAAIWFFYFPQAFGFELVKDTEVIASLAKTQKNMLPVELDLLTWNVQKGAGGDRFLQDLVYLADEKQILLLQEFLEDGRMDRTAKQMNQFQFLTARSFFWDDGKQPTGVATGSAANSVKQFFLRSPIYEPFSETPKMTLITDYLLENGATLKVINTHGINFTSTRALRKQLQAVADSVKDYKGKLIWGGDFNTWNNDRLEILLKITKSLQLKNVVFENDPRFLSLDHVFYRGCKLLYAHILKQVESSDHYPVYSAFDCQ
jgi:endonuclease/exonuclease/phosphatase (EEP) superfamily protein YafD